jgi:hypothetical protein
VADPAAITIGLRRLGLLEKSQPISKAAVMCKPVGKPAAMMTRYQDRPMMDAVAISSSSNAKDTLPDAE